MAEIKTKYGTNTDITITLSSLASSATFVAGRECTEIDNTTNLFVDAMVKGVITVGTTPTANTEILVYVWGSDESLGTTGIDVLDGTDSAETLTNTGVLNAALRLGAVITVLQTTSDVAYDFKPFSVAQLFGGIMPKFWGLFVTHNTGTNLNSTGSNHVISYNGVTFDST